MAVMPTAVMQNGRDANGRIKGKDQGMSDSVQDPDHAPWPSPLYRDLVDELRRITHRRKGFHADAVLEESAFAILLRLADGPRTLRDLAEELDLDQSTVNRQVNAAINHGYIERYDVAGSLSKLLRPTEAGTKAFHHDGMLRVTRLNRVFADLEPGTPAALLHGLRAYNDAYDRVLDAERDDLAQRTRSRRQG